MIKQYDNGLTDEQQKIVDARYKELMAQLKEVNPHYHAYIMKELKRINDPKYFPNYLTQADKRVLFTKQLELSL